MTRAEWSALKAAAESARAHRLDVVSSPAASPAAILRLVAHVERLEAELVLIRDALAKFPDSADAVAHINAALAATKEPDRG